ncbi:MAG: DUF3179 domain-containing (seleno)protein [Runella sp.]
MVINKTLFYIGIVGFILFEIANVYFIMPLPGSQRMNSIEAAYFLYTWRWWFRGGFLLLALVAPKPHKWILLFCMVVVGGVAYMTNFQMAADTMFYQPSDLQLKNEKENKVSKDRLVLGVEINGHARAYPIQFIGYHHQVQDTLSGKPIIVTYCTVCRTGRVFEPMVQGKVERFRLVGMDHFNAMFEDATTQSWWRQANGEAIVGPLKGTVLPEIETTQTTLQKWLELYPNSLVMQPDMKFKAEYDSLSNYESGKRKGKLTRRDTASWKEKSWVVGIALNEASKAFDWNRLQKEHIINDVVGEQPIVLVLARDKKSFFAFKRRDFNHKFTVQNDTLIDNDGFRYSLLGKSEKPTIADLVKIKAYQEYWHSWQTFQPYTKR